MTGSPRRRPSAALVVALAALVISVTGTALAGPLKHLISGSSIKKHSIPGNRLKNNTLGGAQINESKLGVVPHAALADNATTAANANALGNQPASAYLPASKVLRWSFSLNKPGSKTIGPFGPLTFTASCTADGTKTDAKLSVGTSEAGTFVSNNPGALPGPFTPINPGDSFPVVEQDTVTPDDGNSGYFVGFDAQNTLAVFSSAQTIGLAINTPGADCRFFGYLVNDA
jgi:hypothetical protein